MGNSLCSCNNKQDGKNEVQLNEKDGHKITFNEDTITRDMDNVETKGKSKAGVRGNFNANNLSPELKNPDLLTLTKIIKLQRMIKNFGLRFKNKNSNKLEEKMTTKSTGIDQFSPSAPDFGVTGSTGPGLESKKTNFGDNMNFEYFGQRKNGEKDGFGIQKWKDGAVYTGIFRSNRANEIGVFRHSDGDEYKGEFLNDRACGFGLYRHSNGATYEGYWLDDCQDGIGEEKWSDESQYIGNYVKGKKQGIGVYLWSDKSRYEGEWHENCLHGYGIYYFNDDRIYMGQWQYNSMHGYGEFKWKDGKRYAGYYVRDKKEGFGIYYWANPNRVYIGFWKGGKQDGIGKYINPKVTRFGLWKNGEREKWFNSEKDAMEAMNAAQTKFRSLFKLDLKEIANFLA